jgi:hypothetical protein
LLLLVSVSSKVLQGEAGGGEALRSDDLRPVLLDLGDPVVGVGQRLPAAGGG